MAEHTLIDGYVAEVRRALGRHRDVADLVDEIADHLESSVREWRDRGLDADAAQRRSLAAFGDPLLVARTYAAERRRGLAVPTCFTRASGLPLLTTGVTWMWASALFLLSGLAERTRPWESLPRTLFLVAVIPLWIGGIALGVGLVGVYRRHGGGGRLPVIAITVLVLGALVSSLPWLVFGWIPLIAVGAVLLTIWLRQWNLAPRASSAALAGGSTVAAGIALAIGVLTGGDFRVLNGTQRLIVGLGIFGGVAVFAKGVARLGRWLAAEDPGDDPEQALVT
jgi:hypothetical protein